MSDDTPRVHLYVGRGLTFADNVLCGNATPTDNHATENGLQVTCPTCRELLRVAQIPMDDHYDDDLWSDDL